jgi:hypothetical protein
MPHLHVYQQDADLSRLRTYPLSGIRARRIRQAVINAKNLICLIRPDHSLPARRAFNHTNPSNRTERAIRVPRRRIKLISRTRKAAKRLRLLSGRANPIELSSGKLSRANLSFFLLSVVTDPAVAFRRLQVPELGGGAVPRPGHPMHADLRAGAVRPGRNDR